MDQYIKLAKNVLENGEEREDRTGTGIIGIFGGEVTYNLQEGFPLLTTKEIDPLKPFGEMMWFLSGDTNAHTCAETYDFKIWKKWAGEDGDLGPIYGKQWRSWLYGKNISAPIDQIKEVINSLKYNRYSRRHVVSAWAVHELQDMALPPCHLLFQFYVSNNGELSCKLYQRSADVFLGVPFNVAGYAYLTHIIAHLTGYNPGKFIHSFGDVHIYLNHVEQMKEQIKRDPRPLPVLEINKDMKRLEDFYNDNWKDCFAITGYNPHSKITGEVSV